MSNLFYIWLASWVFFLLIEMLTATFYGLSISIASFILALYVYLTGDTTITVAQGFIMVVISAVFAYFLPKYLKSDKDEFKTGLDAHIGQVFRLEKVGNDWKVKIDGVDYLVDDNSVNPEFSEWKKVKVESHQSGILTVTLEK